MTPTTTIVTEKQLTTTRAEAQKVTQPVVAAANQITVKDAASYSVADAFLKKIRLAIRTVDEKIDPIILPIRSGLDLLYELKRDLHKPLDEAESVIKQKMKDWQLVDRKRIAEEEAARRREETRLRELAEAKQREEDRLRREAEEADRRAEQARTKAQREKAEAEAAELRKQQAAASRVAARIEQKADVAAATPVSGPTKATSSRVTEVRRWRVTSLSKFISAVASGVVKADDTAGGSILEINQSVMNRCVKDFPEEVAEWPGIEVYTDIQISGR